MVYTDGVHLVADSLDELHEFAAKIFLKRDWFQDHPKHPHYDVWGSRLRMALKCGAKKISSKEIVMMFKNFTDTKSNSR